MRAALIAAAALAAVAAAGCGRSASRARTSADATSLTPGVVTVARLHGPAGEQLTLTLQRIRFEGAHYVCLYARQPPAPAAAGAPAPPGGSASGTCAGPLPLPDRPLTAITAAFVGCRSELVWGLARTDVSVSLGAHGARRAAVPGSLRVPGSVLYVWASGTVVARDRGGAVVERSTVNAASCGPRVGPSHGQTVHPYRPGPIQVGPSHGQTVHPYRPGVSGSP